MQRRLTLLTATSSRLTAALSRKTTYTMSPPKSDIHLYTAATPNGIKISILLEELGLPYKVTEISLSKNEQKTPDFLNMNPNGRIPVITDTWGEHGQTINVWESGAIMQYLVERYDGEGKLSYPRGTKEAWEVNCWLMWQMGGLGPMQGQANHFFRYAPTKIEYGIQRYQGETRRLYSVLEMQLAKSTSGYLVGDKCTIADISCWGWVASHDWAGVSLDGFPKLAEWVQRMLDRPGVKKGANVPKPTVASKSMTEEEKDKVAKETSAWVQQGNDHTAKK